MQVERTRCRMGNKILGPQDLALLTAEQGALLGQQKIAAVSIVLRCSNKTVNALFHLLMQRIVSSPRMAIQRKRE